MIEQIHIEPNSQNGKILFFRDVDLSSFPTPKIIPLFGPNGVGKTTLINGIANCIAHTKMLAQQTAKIAAQYSDEEEAANAINDDYGLKLLRQKLQRTGITLQFDTPNLDSTCVLTYSNRTGNLSTMSPKTESQAFNPVFIAAKWNAKHLSEGQSNVFSVYDLIDGINQKWTVVYDQVIILLDEIDSGLSIDNIDMFMGKLRHRIRTISNIQIFLGFNSPRVLKHFPNVLSMYDGTALELHDEQDMVDEIRKHAKEFNKARKYSNGRPRVFE